MTITDIIKILETANRIGQDTDSLEGTRYIQISDTLAKIMARDLSKEQNKILAVAEALPELVEACQKTLRGVDSREIPLLEIRAALAKMEAKS